MPPIPEADDDRVPATPVIDEPEIPGASELSGAIPYVVAHRAFHPVVRRPTDRLTGLLTNARTYTSQSTTVGISVAHVLGAGLRSRNRAVPRQRSSRDTWRRPRPPSNPSATRTDHRPRPHGSRTHRHSGPVGAVDDDGESLDNRPYPHRRSAYHRGELLASCASHPAPTTEVRTEMIGGCDDHRVPHSVSERVVDRLELIEVGDQDADRETSGDGVVTQARIGAFQSPPGSPRR